MSRDLWLQSRPVIRTEKIPKTITLSAATFNAGSALFGKSVYFNGDYDSLTTAPSLLSNTAFTIEAWLYTRGQQNDTLYPVYWDLNENIAPFKPRYLVIIYNRFVHLFYTKGGTVSLIVSTNTVSAYDWTHIAITWDGTTVKMYLDGILDKSQAVASPVDAPAAGGYTVGYARYLADRVFVGNIAELRVWNLARTSDEIYFSRFGPRELTGVRDDGLVHYYKLGNIISVGSIHEYISNTNLSVVTPGSIANDTEKGPPLKYGASFIVANYAITLTKKVSLKFPLAPSVAENCTGQLCISWIDDNDKFQRRKLWTKAGVDISPLLAEYSGEPLATSFTLEFWNIDGQSTAVIAENIVLQISDTTDPINSFDHTAIVAYSPTADGTLAEIFPWVFPLSFNTQQTFPS